ncbi:hypothetical protein [Streptomyces sp. NPDC056399]|uniref:hypothetical protein n=1 Tax=Streptomyces sp. NPDC056399 TaxID=3345807 RepID=UPI0035E198D0
MRLAETLAERLDRAAYLYNVPLHPPAPASRQVRTTPSWMDAERNFRAQWWPERLGTLPDPFVRISAERRDALTRRLEEIEARGRIPRICLYAAGPSNPSQREALDAAQEFADARGWRMKGECSTDVYSTVPADRAGWSEILDKIRGCFLDGVVLPAYDEISPYAGEYEVQLRRVDSVGGFVVLVSPETGGAR